MPDDFSEGVRKVASVLSQTWPARLAQSAYSALTLPGDVYQGNVSMYGADGHTSPDVIGRSADLAGLMTLGAGAVPAEANTLRSGMKIYRGEYSGNKGGNFYTSDPEFARQFTQSGLPEEVINRVIDDGHIHIPEKPVFAGDVHGVDAEIARAKLLGKKAVQLDEGEGQPPSYFVFDKSALAR